TEGKYTARGKWMDGWETRRRRGPGHDWCIIRLGIPGVIRAITVDTHHFVGNHPAACSLEAADLPRALGAAPLPAAGAARVACRGGRATWGTAGRRGAAVAPATTGWCCGWAGAG